jgi:hypothetical protein
MTTNAMLKFNTELLSAEFAGRLQIEARKYGLIASAKSKKQWLVGDMINAEWKRNPDFAAEITREEFYIECSRVMNSGMSFPVVGESGQTLRRWCEVAESFANMPALEEFKEVLSFDHFFQARRMANKPEIYHLSTPALALAEAVIRKWDSAEMVYHFSPKEPVHEYDKTIGWLDSLQAIKLEWIKSKDDREKAIYHLSEFRRIVEASDRLRVSDVNTGKE